ncbi:DUF1338 domain-containing protein [Herbaspirillum autotrophicum]|uniref:DUF1338 domain-containing protein n=1 Tax=Herbaspirillum autotrophicum TaxID=180195 RepID=UPI00067D0F02|nr:DUF1338 domain-containing protein [Herbaspirillum autotrophicum]
MPSSNLHQLLQQIRGAAATQNLFAVLQVPPRALQPPAAQVSRLEIAQALNMLLFEQLLDTVPEARAYVDDAIADGRKLRFDHGALRTVLTTGTGALPAGEAAITRVLLPLGYRANGLYPLDRIGMTGRSYAHEDDAEEVAQFFVSELHPERFSSDFQQTVSRILSSSVDPIDAASARLLEQLAQTRALPVADAAALLPVLLNCFSRQHALPTLADYEQLLQESAEMAWIATEGNVFNHATDRVDDVESVAQRQRDLGRPIKDKIEVSRNGRVRQTAFRATTVVRMLRDAHGQPVARKVPGSFYEFIARDSYLDPDTNAMRLDLSFDSGNAQGIFKMTAGAAKG